MTYGRSVRQAIDPNEHRPRQKALCVLWAELGTIRIKVVL